MLFQEASDWFLRILIYLSYLQSLYQTSPISWSELQLLMFWPVFVRPLQVSELQYIYILTMHPSGSYSHAHAVLQWLYIWTFQNIFTNVLLSQIKNRVTFNLRREAFRMGNYSLDSWLCGCFLSVINNLRWLNIKQVDT